MANQYTMKAFMQHKHRANAIRLVNKSAVEQAAQMFLDLYMSPGDFSDAPYRLGRAIGYEEGLATVDASTFPPYDYNSVTKEELPHRLGGFKVVNDRINHLQKLLRVINGEIRTKITEWDMSLYLQEAELFDKEDILNYSIMYRMLQDNPRRYRDSRAFVFGIVNTALSSYRWYRWNPKADKDLRYWAPPTSSLELWAYPPRPYKKTIKVVRRFLWWSKTSYKSVWVTPKRPTLNRHQQQEVHFALRAKWTNWYPPYWKLFFHSPDINSLDDEDEEEFNASLSKKRNSKWSKAVRGKSKGDAAGRAAATQDNKLGKKARSTGINLKSPILYGRPLGRWKDPRSIAGYLESSPQSASLPKISPSADRNDPINSNYDTMNPTEGIQTLMNGWVTTYPVLRYREERRYVWVSTDYDNDSSYRSNYRYRRYTFKDNRGRRYNRSGYYQLRTVQVPYWFQMSKIGEHPNARFTIRHDVEPFLSYWRILLFLFFPFGTLAAIFRRPNMSYVIESIKGDSSVDGKLNTTDKVPVFMVSADGSTVVKMPIYKGTRYQKYRKKVRFLFRKRWVTRYKKVPCYKVDLGRTDFYVTGLRTPRPPRWLWWRRTAKRPSSTRISNYRAYPRHIAQMINPSRAMAFKGLFFSISSTTARGLNGSSNFITDGWSMGGGAGATIARAFTTGMWKYGNGLIGSPLHANMAGAYYKLKPVAPALKELSELLNTINPNTMKALLNALEKETRKKPAVQQAYRVFSTRNILYLQNRLAGAVNAIDGLFNVLEPIVLNGESALTYDRVKYFYYNYPKVTTLVTSPFIRNMLVAYLTLLYEWRIIYIKQRMNKVDGTLTQVARIEVSLALMDESTYNSPDLSDSLIAEDLEVRHKTTNITLAQKAYAKQNNTTLPEERIRIVYVPVQYTDDGEIIRHQKGTYQLLSTEYLEDSSIPDVRFWITFTGPKQPRIVKNVMTNVNHKTLSQIIADPNLTMLEKVCAARELEDWWEIKIPKNKWPLSKDFDTQLMLTLTPTDRNIEETAKVLGDFATSPILETQDRMMVGTTWAAVDEVTNYLNPTAKRK